MLIEMKKLIFILAAMQCGMFMPASAAAPKVANDTTIVVKVSPDMHCENCEKKIKGNIRFERGVKSIATDRAKQTVTIKADKSKLKEGGLEKAFGKIGYKITPVKAGADK